ncbi:bacillithiol biosynthesis deacetylase BshB1 [Paenibacillus doosanensis]|uniref:Mycothiol S-conjugate amidase n=1 Tax=Paenibacillus konkukensis TaxID=2020716 RepID=A0ABY4RHJ2_9BACL|nr:MULTISPECIES: bacillithiol biosynthesis deacetylase BshB1 [Paenibacillus]MCS7462502.1 bacillithiol biosynthesis deacetylase BshB1 [Paenibacillus doosanensis]UQZ81891.1 Mycothiol S-conjugate amidase [Paenibacillus konkukensis]
MTEALDILIFGAHPDDAEIGMGGTIAKHTAAGYKVGICDLTYAEMSSNGTVELRQKEAAQASDILGLAARSNLGLPDRGLRMEPDQIRAITLQIRKYKPRIVFAPYWEDRHPDHIACSKLVQEALFNAKLRKYEPQTEAHTVVQSYFYFINDVAESDLLVDITDVHGRKMQALGAYRTQFEAVGANNDFVATPLNQGYLERVEAKDRMLGQKRMVPYAEGFVSKLPYMVDLF